MSQILLWIAVAVGFLLLMYAIPVTRIFAEAGLKICIDLGSVAGKHIGNGTIWLIKTLISDHIQLVRHALTPRNTMDPTQKIRRDAAGYE